MKTEENKEYDLPQTKTGHQVDAPDIKPKHMFIFKPSKGGMGVEMQGQHNKSEMSANDEAADATNGISIIVDSSYVAEKVKTGRNQSRWNRIDENYDMELKWKHLELVSIPRLFKC